MSNRSLRNNRRRRYAARQRGGANIPAFGTGNMDTNTGLFAGASTTGAGSGSGVPINTWGPANTSCDAIPRTTTELNTQAYPDSAANNAFPFSGGHAMAPFSAVPPMANAVQFNPSGYNTNQMGGRRTKKHVHAKGKRCPLCKGVRKQRGGGCPCMSQRGGGSPQGLAQFPDAFALSGGGPNVGNPVNTQSGCDPRAGSPEDPHAPINHIQRGGSYMSIASAAPLTTAFPATPQPSYGAANAFPESCYKAPGSELPVYNNNSAAFNFSPSIVENNTLPPGVNVYNDVIQQPGRMGAPLAGAGQEAPLAGAGQEAPDQRGGSRRTKKHKPRFVNFVGNNGENNRRNNRRNSRKASRKSNRKGSRKGSRRH